MTYAEYVRNYLEQQGQGVPIYTDEIADALAADYKIDKKKAAAAFDTHASDHGKPSDCVACRGCENHCPQNLPIADLMVKVKERFEA